MSESPTVPWALAVWTQVLESGQDTEGSMLALWKPSLSVDPTCPTTLQLVRPQRAYGLEPPQFLGRKKEYSLRCRMFVLVLLPTSYGPWTCPMVLKLGYILESPGLYSERFRLDFFKKLRFFHNGSVAKILHCQCRGVWIQSWSGN